MAALFTHWFMLAMSASALSEAPSWNLMPERSLIVQFLNVLSGVIDSAR